MSVCVPPDELSAFNLGELPESRIEEVAEHLEACPRCAAPARALETTCDGFLRDVRSAGADGGPVGCPILRLPAAAVTPRRVGDYEILGELGRGGMGVVYRARHGRLGRVVALKMLLGGDFQDSTRRQRFLGEAAAVARLHHPHIVQLYEAGEHAADTGEAHPYFTLELVEGGNLADRLAGELPPPRQAAAWVEQVAGAVHYAHERGIVHRDLKPSNILLTADGRPKLCDFGVAKVLEGGGVLTRSGLVVGTPEYMAPEQLGGPGRVSPLTDVYALGAVLYALLVGRPPFRAAGVAETLSQVCFREPEPPRRWQPSVPADLDTICLKCLHKEPAKRYPSAAALADDLERFLQGRPIVARPVGPLEQAAKWARRRPAVAGLLAAVVLLAAVGAALVVGLWRGAEAQTEIEHRARTLAQEKATLAQEKVQEQTKSRVQVARLLANTTLDHGLNLCTEGEVDRGMLYLARAQGLAAEAGDLALESVARTNLSAWRSRLIARRGAFGHAGWVWGVAFSPDGRTALTGGIEGSDNHGLAKRWDTATGRPVGRPLPHRYPVWAVTYSPDGRTFLTGSGAEFKGEVRLWDAASGRPVSPPLPMHGEVNGVAFDRDGRRFLAVCETEARVWETAPVLGRAREAPAGRASNEEPPPGLVLPHPKPGQELPEIQPRLWAVFSPDGQMVLTGGEDGTARRWDAATGAPRGEPLRHDGPVLTVAFSPDGRTIATGSSDRTARLWDAAADRPRGRKLPHPGRVQAVAFSSDGRLLATGCAVEETDRGGRRWVSLGGEVRVWRVATGEHVRRPLRLPQPVWDVAFRPGGYTLLAGATDQTARFFDAGGLLLSKPLTHEGTVAHVAFSPDGRLALTASAGGAGFAHARLWELPVQDGGDRAVSFERIPGPDALPVSWTPDGRGFVFAKGKTAQLYDLATGRRVGPALHHVSDVLLGAFSHDGRAFATYDAGNVLRLWEWPSRRLRGECRLRVKAPPIALRTDGRTVTLGFHQQAGLWRVGPAPSSLTALGPMVRYAELAAVSPDGRTAFSREGGRVIRWDLRTGKARCTRKFPSPLSLLTFAGERPVAITYENNQLTRFWDLETGEPFGTRLAEPTGVLGQLAFTADRRWVLVGSWDRRVAQLWDTATGKPIGPPLVHGDAVNLVRFTPDERRMLSFSIDGKFRAAETPRPLAGGPERIRCWVEGLTGMRLDAQGMFQDLGPDDLRQRRQRLREVGGPPDGADGP
jgi:WD40 repeat protein